MLGHDMRSPLQTIQMTAVYLAALNAGDKVSGAATRLIHSGARMQALLDDMLDFNRTKLGLGINISPTTVDLANLFADELNLVRAAHPDHQIDLEGKGGSQGVWDGRRLQQLLGNLVLNAIKYGAPNAPVVVIVTGAVENVRFEVKNNGIAIEQQTMDRLFDPLRRGPNQENKYDADGNLGSDSILPAGLPRPMAEASKNGPTRQKRCSLCACRVVSSGGSGCLRRRRFPRLEDLWAIRWRIPDQSETTVVLIGASIVRCGES
jgi:Histidine kinase-, DNA gyrase B-, and HSP90-like ATPase